MIASLRQVEVLRIGPRRNLIVYAVAAADEALERGGVLAFSNPKPTRPIIDQRPCPLKHRPDGIERDRGERPG